MYSERRRASRYQFIAEAEVFELESEVTHKARTGDLGLGGCFLGMLNSPPEGTEVRVTIFHAATTFTSLAKVIFVFPNTGMGVVFTSLEANQSSVLQEWLSELGRSASIGKT